MAEKQMKVFLNGILLPVPPEKITESVKNQNRTMTTINGQEINLIRPAGLTEIVLSKVLLPNMPYDFMEASSDGGKLAASYYLRVLSEFKRSQQAITLTINGSRDGLCKDDKGASYMVTLEDFKVNQSVENGNDVEVDIKLKQYVEFGLGKVKLEKTKKKTTASRTEKTTKEQTYTVQKGDTLWAIAKKFYGDGSLYPYLAKINNIANPNIIHTGQVLKIGSKEEALAYKPAASTGGTKSSTTTEIKEPVKKTTSTLSGALLSTKQRVLDSDVVIEFTKPLDVLSPSGLDFAKKRAALPSNSVPKAKIDISPVNGAAINLKPKIDLGGGGGHGI